MRISIYHLSLFLVYLKTEDAACGFKTPCPPKWTYSILNGKCYYFYKELKTFSDATMACMNDPPNGYFPGRTKLVEYKDANDLQAIVTAMGPNVEEQWVNKIDSFGNEVPVGLEIIVKISPPTWKPLPTRADDLSKKLGFGCEFAAMKCSTTFPFFDARTEMTTETGFVGVTAKIVCKHGYYDNKKREPKSTTCSVIKSGVDDKPNKMTAGWIPAISNLELPECKSVSCGSLECKPNYRVDFVNTAQGSEYGFGYAVDVSCKRGFVNYKNSTLTKSKYLCDQSRKHPKNGKWRPQNCQTCTSVPCDMETMKGFTPIRGRLIRAKNIYSDETFGDFQVIEFNQFGNIVTIQCDDGYYFPDRVDVKQVFCDLANDSLIVGEWRGYQGTLLPMPKECIKAKCKYQEVEIKPDQNIRLEYTYMETADSTPVFRNVSSIEDYPFGCQLNFTCQAKFQTADKMKSQVVRCGNGGHWMPQLTTCLETLKDLDTGAGKHFVPPAKESKYSSSVGAIAIIFVLLLFGFIIFLDLATITKDVQYLKANWKVVKEKLKTNGV